ncbi:S-layer homology domain-containing protein [Chungangia koreensis]|uniref:S-layer homology domain-containing protein n=1 Tax=Chungangia koreensis TaxID=752657 RepID=A0ABV8X3Y2_9LACT
MRIVAKRLFMSILTAILVVSLLPMSAMAGDEELVGITLQKEMQAMIDQGIIQGFDNEMYYPRKTVTRGQFATFLMRALELEEATGSYPDVANSSALAKGIYAASEAGLMNGYSDGRFGPYDEINREQLAIVVENVLGKLNMKSDMKTIEFTDKADFTSSSAVRSVYYAAYFEILSGIPNGDGTFSYNSKGNAERQHAAKVIYQLLAAIENFEQPPVEQPPVEQPPVEQPPAEPPVDPSVFQIATIQNGALVKDSKTYTDYDTAAEAFKNNTNAQGLYKGNELIRIKIGMAYAADTKANTASIYEDPTFKKQATYIVEGRELRYIDANADFVKVQVAGTVGFMKHSEVEMIPLSLVKGRDYYVKNDYGTITHYTYNYLSNSYGGYQIGTGPSTMERHVKYYSYDGIHFANDKGQLQFTFYPYFQYLNIRSNTNYTAEELDSYITTRLAELEATGLTRYKNATTISKLIGMGSYIKQMETDYKVNSLFILAAAIHESDYGMSGNAQNKNNLFGIKVYDSDPNAGEKYVRPENSILAFVNQYINANYAPPIGLRAMGAVPGNKTSGFNVNYAADPNWGAKIAGHMWRADIALGNKDMRFYQLGMTNTSASLNVRSAPDPNTSNVLFTYRPKNLGFNNGFGYPVVIVDEAVGTDGAVWYKVLSDLTSSDYGWIHSAYVNKITY